MMNKIQECEQDYEPQTVYEQEPAGGIAKCREGRIIPNLRKRWFAFMIFSKLFIVDAPKLF